jgi:AcrR family transcriptional regulator
MVMTTRSYDRVVTESPEPQGVPTATWDNLAADKRERILTAAMAEFGAHGFSSASLNVVARDAGIAKGSLFAYFNDKLDLYAYVCDACSSRIRDTMVDAIGRRAEALGDDLTLFGLLRVTLLDWVAYFDAHPLERGVTLATNFEMDPDVRRTVRAVVNRHYTEVLRPMLKPALDSGELRADVDIDHLLALLLLLLPHLALAPSTPELDPVLGMYGADPTQLADPVHGMLGVLERAFATTAA